MIRSLALTCLVWGGCFPQRGANPPFRDAASIPRPVLVLPVIECDPINQRDSMARDARLHELLRETLAPALWTRASLSGPPPMVASVATQKLCRELRASAEQTGGGASPLLRKRLEPFLNGPEQTVLAISFEVYSRCDQTGRGTECGEVDTFNARADLVTRDGEIVWSGGMDVQSESYEQRRDAAQEVADTVFNGFPSEILKGATVRAASRDDGPR